MTSQKSGPKFTPLKILNTREKTEIEEKLREQFGIEEIPGTLIKRGKERIFLYNGFLEKRDIKRLEKLVIIERAGIYFAKIVFGEDGEIRLSLEGTQILKDKIKRNVYNLNKKQAEEWMKGGELRIKTGRRGFLVMKYGEDFLGCGKASAEKIGNFIPKNRRLKRKG
ncbi:MAG: hypothetical protein WDZ62_00240 [Candidatus Pacearchaeota archaeon]